MLVSESVLSNVINSALNQGADFCEVYVEEQVSNLMELKSSQVEYLSGRDMGVGIRLFYKNQEFYTYTNCLDEKSLMKALNSLISFNVPPKNKTKSSKEDLVFSFKKEFPQECKIDLQKEKKFLQQLDKEGRANSSLISQCVFVLKRIDKRVQIANSESVMCFDHRPYFFFRVHTVAEENNEQEFGHNSLGRTENISFLEEEILRKKCQKAHQMALRNLKADYSPAGNFPVIINKGFGGVIFHEACGHGLETTLVAEKQSIFSDKLGQKIASDCVSAYDDGTLKGEYGSIKKDDEGYDTQKTCLIEKGVLKNFMTDKMGSQKTKYPRTGNARRQNYKYPPTSRMRNTYIEKGSSSLEEMIQDVDYGLFAESLGGGSVSPGTGNYNFAVSSGFLIKNGKIAQPVKGASLIGNGLDSLCKIQKVGKDLELAPGHCGSISGWVPVTVGQPPILLSNLTVGGRKK
ncbi:MAG: TldD/PmbA family protein [Bdellovibrionales bacterium]|nr:TldD/PmbA family protein [Bdellovibrionales bacterium]